MYLLYYEWSDGFEGETILLGVFSTIEKAKNAESNYVKELGRKGLKIDDKYEHMYIEEIKIDTLLNQ